MVPSYSGEAPPLEARKRPPHDGPPSLDILLEAGTNELEVMIFTLDGNPYAINVAKVCEVIMAPQVRRLPSPPPSVEGVFMHRQRPVSIVRLRALLNLRPYASEQLADPTGTRVIVAEFNQRLTAFRVDSVERIFRVRGGQIRRLPRASELETISIVAMIELEDGLIPILDFETMVYDLGGGREEGGPAAVVAQAPPAARATRRIVVAEDSATIRRLVSTRLKGRGYEHVQLFEDGQQAWDWLSAVAAGGAHAVAGSVDLVVSDIEMPQMDGLRLCRLIRESEPLKPLPVILFSSLVNAGNEKKGDAVGATAQISKPDITLLIEAVDRILFGEAAAPAAATT